MLIEAIKTANSIAIGGHVRPDGDCVGSCLGIYSYVKEQFPDKQIDVYLESIPEPFQFLKRADEQRLVKSLARALQLLRGRVWI